MEIVRAGAVLGAASIVVAVFPALRGVIEYSFWHTFLLQIVLMASITAVAWIAGRLLQANWPLLRLSIITALSVLVLIGLPLFLFANVIFEN